MRLNSLSRRGLMRAAAALAAVASLPRLAWAEWNKNAFEAKNLADAMKALGASGAPTVSGDVQIIASDLAENGAVVPVQGTSKIPGTTMIAFLVEKNPFILAGSFDITPEMVPDVSTRIKMGQTSNVIVLVKAGDKFYSASKEIKVTLGGCGG